MIPKETIDTIFETARIEEVVGDFVTLKKRGANTKGLIKNELQKLNAKGKPIIEKRPYHIQFTIILL